MVHGLFSLWAYHKRSVKKVPCPFCLTFSVKQLAKVIQTIKVYRIGLQNLARNSQSPQKVNHQQTNYLFIQLLCSIHVVIFVELMCLFS